MKIFPSKIHAGRISSTVHRKYVMSWRDTGWTGRARNPQRRHNCKACIRRPNPREDLGMAWGFVSPENSHSPCMSQAVVCYLQGDKWQDGPGSSPNRATSSDLNDLIPRGLPSCCWFHITYVLSHVILLLDNDSKVHHSVFSLLVPPFQQNYNISREWILF